MKPEELLQECETLTFSGRIRLMVKLGQQAASDASAGETLAALARGDVYQRLLATQACYGSRNSTQVLQSLSDPSLCVRKLALELAPLVCNDPQLQSALEQLPPDLKMKLMRRLSKRLRKGPIDAYLETLEARNDSAINSFLPYGSRSLVERHFEQGSERFDLATWCRFGRNYPDLVIAQLLIQAGSSDLIDPQLIIRINEVLPHLTKSAPDATLDFVKALIATLPLARLSLQPLVKKRPNEMADLLLQSNEQSTIQFDPVAQRLDPDRLLALFTRYQANINTYTFDKLRPQQRLVVYTACERGWRDAQGVLSYHIVAALPGAQRLQEGRRHLALPILATRPLEQLPYAAFLPWDEARALLNTPLRSPDPLLRGAAIKALINTARYERERLAEVLRLVQNRRNEQDPVRREMLSTLTSLPHGIWQPEHLDSLTQIIRDALNAKDLSSWSANAMERLVVQLFTFHPQWSANQMAIIYRERGRISVFQLERYLSDADIRRIAPVLTPILQSWQQRENEQLLVILAIALGKRLSAFKELADLLEATLDRTLKNGIANSILQLFLEHRRADTYLLIPRLLRHDKSASALPAVYTYLHRYRQDLLTPFLGQYAYKGRFSTGHTRFVLPLYNGFYRWTSTQQETFAQTLLSVIDQKDQNRATYELISAIQRLAAMPFLNFAPLIQFASDERQTIRERALYALGKLDAGQGIPTLLEALNDERARVAIYALREALLSMAPDKALNLLRNAPMTLVTVAKEVVRLIGELFTENAYQELLSLETRDLHRDVQVALLRALWDYPQHAETWEIFTRAARAPETALARGVVHVPADGLSPLEQKRLTALTDILLSHPTPEVRMETLKWRGEHPITDDEHILFTHLLALMNSHLPDEGALAARAIFAIYTGNNAALVSDAVRNLLPNRRGLLTAINNYTSEVRYTRERLLSTTRAILAALIEDRLTVALQVEVILMGLPWEEIAPELLKLTDRLHADALLKAQERLQDAYLRPDARLLELETTLAASQDERLRRLALAALIAQSNQADGWSDERITRLKAYREDISPLVAEAAQFTFVPFQETSQ